VLATVAFLAVVDGESAGRRLDSARRAAWSALARAGDARGVAALSGHIEQLRAEVAEVSLRRERLADRLRALDDRRHAVEALDANPTELAALADAADALGRMMAAADRRLAALHDKVRSADAALLVRQAELEARDCRRTLDDGRL
jgi:hypothetical protein